jgi:hypothetical protein
MILNDLITILVLSVIVIAQGVERYFHTQQVQKEKTKLLDEMSKLVKALISKNANDYVMTTSIDKVAPEEKAPQDPDLIDPDQLTDDEFDSALGIKRVAPKP